MSGHVHQNLPLGGLTPPVTHRCRSVTGGRDHASVVSVTDEQALQGPDNSFLIVSPATRTDVVDVRQVVPESAPNDPSVSVVSAPDERPPAKGWALTMSEAAEQCVVSRSTIRRRQEAGDFPNAYKDGEGAWRIPIRDLQLAGLKPGKPSLPDAVSEPPAQERARLVEVNAGELALLREQLVDTQKRNAFLEGQASMFQDVITANEKTVSALESALGEAQRAIEASPTPSTGGVSAVSAPVERPKRRLFRRRSQS